MGGFWDEFRKNKPIIEKLQNLGANSVVGWTGGCPEGSDHFTYLIGENCPAGTVVPQGLDLEDLPQSFAAKGSIGMEISGVVGHFSRQGFTTCYADIGWNSELHLQEEQKPDERMFHWLIPCIKFDETT